MATVWRRSRRAPPASPAPAEQTAAVLAELDTLIGLSSVKNQVRELIAVVQANEERRKAGLPAVNTSLHLVFTGSPGTGKTTVARLVARLYAAAGVLKGSKLLEATRGQFERRGAVHRQLVPKPRAAGLQDLLPQISNDQSIPPRLFGVLENVQAPGEGSPPRFMVIFNAPREEMKVECANRVVHAPIASPVDADRRERIPGRGHQ